MWTVIVKREKEQNTLVTFPSIKNFEFFEYIEHKYVKTIFIYFLVIINQ